MLGLSPMVPIGDFDSLSDAIDTDGLDAWSWLRAAIILVASFAVAMGVRWLFTRLLGRRLDRTVAVLIGRLVGYVIVVVGLVYSLDSLGVRVGPLVGALGILGIALAYAFRDILENFVAGVLLQIRRPFTFGDEVELDEHTGRVVDIDARVVTLATADGETVLVPSAKAVKTSIVNLSTHGKRRSDLPIGVAYGSDLRVAHEVLSAAVANSEGVLAEPAAQVLLVGFGESSIDFVVRFWHGPLIADFWNARSTVAFAVEAALADADITIPFPQRTLWMGAESDESGGPTQSATVWAADNPEL